MAIKLADVLLYLGVDDDKLSAGLKAAENVADSWGKNVSGKLNDVMRGSLERVGHMATDMVATGVRSAAGLVVESIAAAGDLGESINKVNVVFDTSSETIQRWSQGASTALGQSRQQALEAVGTFGNLFDSMGIGSEKTAEMSTGLVELASDLASFNNIDPSIALEKLRAGIVGEVEPLRTLGVNLTAVAVEAKALQMGIVQTDVDMNKLNRATLNLEKANTLAATALAEHGQESLQYREAAQKVAEAEAQIEDVLQGKKPVLDAAQKAQAAYALIFEQTANAQGDFARTSEGAANAQRILDAQMADMKSTIGEAFLPVWNELLIAMNTMLKDAMPGIASFVKGTLGPAILELIATVKEWVSWFMALDPATQGLIAKTAGFIAVLVPLLGILAPVIGAISGLVGIITAVAPVVATAGGAIALLTNPITLVYAAVVGLTVAWHENWFGIRDITAEATSAIGATLSQWWADFKLGASSALDAVRGWWEAHDQDVQAVATTHWATLGSLWQTQWELLRGVSTAGVQFLTGDWDGGLATLSETAGTFWDNVKGLFQNQLDQVRNLFALFGWGDIGEAIVRGIANGISNAASFMAEAAVDAAKRAFDAAAEWLQIGSPSKRAEKELGEPTGVGWGNGVMTGIGKATDGIKDAMAGVFANLAQSANDALANYLQSAAQYSGDYLNDWLMDVPEALREDAKTIGQYLASIKETGGDYLNDWLQQVPESMRDIAKQAGEMIAKFGLHPDVVDEALRNVIAGLTSQVRADSSSKLSPATAAVGEVTTSRGDTWSISLVQNFYGQVAPNDVATAAEGGLVRAMRARGMF